MKTDKFSFSFIFYIFILIFFDILVLICSLNIAVSIRINFPTDIFPLLLSDEIKNYYWMIILSLFIFMYERIYFIRYDFWGDIKRVLKGLILSFTIVFTVITLSKMSDNYSRSFIILFFVLSSILIPISKRFLKKILFSFDFFKVKVYIEAKGEQEKILLNELNDNWYFGFKPSKKKYDMVLIASKKFTIDELSKLIRKYTKKTKDIYVIPYLEHLDFSHTIIVDYSNIRLSAIHIENRLLNYKNIIIKTIFEKALVIFISPFVLLAHIIISILIKLDSSGPVRFKQKRFGRNGKPFTCYKYRTMYIENENLLKKYLKDNPEEVEYYSIYCKYQNDPRITRIGKFLRKTSLDEFPQFFNIIRGDMNLIGPRPYMLDEKEKIGKVYEEVIFEVKPGITGLWQVSGRNELTFRQRVELDKWYIQNWSLWMDFVIFVKTLKVVFSKVGAK